MKTIQLIIYFSAYSMILAFSIVTLVFFLPFSYVDNDHSYVRCQADGVAYETSPNLIFLVDAKLDNFNDVKARKLCEYHVIRDYNRTYATPKRINYTLEVAKKQSSSFPNALFAFGLTFLLGSIITEITFKQLFKSQGRYHKLLFTAIENLIS